MPKNVDILALLKPKEGPGKFLDRRGRCCLSYSLPVARVVLPTRVKTPGSLRPHLPPPGRGERGGTGEGGAGARAEGLGLSQLPGGVGIGC